MRILASCAALLAVSGCGWMFRDGNSTANDPGVGNIVVQGNASAAGQPGPSGFPGFGTNSTLPGPPGDNTGDMTADQGGTAGPPRPPVSPPDIDSPPPDQGSGKPTDDGGDGDGGDQGDDGGKPTDGDE